jgi:hypothetical protein
MLKKKSSVAKQQRRKLSAEFKDGHQPYLQAVDAAFGKKDRFRASYQDLWATRRQHWSPSL